MLLTLRETEQKGCRNVQFVQVFCKSKAVFSPFPHPRLFFKELKHTSKDHTQRLEQDMGSTSPQECYLNFSVLWQSFPNTSVTVESKGIHYLNHSLGISWNGPLPCWNKCLKSSWWGYSHSVVPQFIISDTSFSTTRPRASHSLADLLAPELELWIRD